MQPDYARMIEVKVSFDTDRKRATEDTRHWAVLALHAGGEDLRPQPRRGWSGTAEPGSPPSAPQAAGSSRPTRTNMSSGSAITLISASTISSFSAPGPDQERFIRLYAEHVLPRLRRRVGAPVETPKERMTSLEVIALTGLPLIKAGDDLVEMIASVSQAERRRAAGAGTCFVVAQKIVSKAEGRMVDLATIKPSARADRPRDRSRQGPASRRGHNCRSPSASCGRALTC